MAENTAKKTNKKGKMARYNKRSHLKNTPPTTPATDNVQTEEKEKTFLAAQTKINAEPAPIKLKPYEIYIIVAVIALLALIGYTISRNSLPEKSLPPQNENTELKENNEEPQSILGFTELKDQYALCANLLFLSQYDAGNEAGSMDILRIANQKYQKLTGELIEENPAMQAQEMEILRKIINDKEHPEAKQKLVKDCTEAITVFEEIYDRQEMLDHNAENAGD